MLKGHWCDIFVLNAPASTGDKGDNSKHSFNENMEQMFIHLPKHNMNILLGDFNAKLGREGILKLVTWKESLHEGSNDNSVKVVNSVMSTMFCHQNIHNNTRTCLRGR